MINFQETIKILTNGANTYNSGKDYQSKKKGYEQYKLGTQMMINYGKELTDQQSKDTIKQRVQTCLESLKQMSLELNNLQEQVKQENNQPQKNVEMPKQPQELQPAQKPQVIAPQDSDEDQGFKEILDSIVVEKPNTKFSDIVGLEQAKAALKEAVVLPIMFPDMFKNTKPWRGILMYGPPGIFELLLYDFMTYFANFKDQKFTNQTLIMKIIQIKKRTGKTYLAKACASECDCTFFSISSSDLISKYVGESEQLIKCLFKKAKEMKPSIIFIDEIDSLVGNRGGSNNESSARVVTEFLAQMNGVGKELDGVLVLGATNLPWKLDQAIRRRFEKRVFIDLPTLEARAIIAYNLLKTTPNNLSLQDIEYIASVTEGYSGADLSVLLREASFEPLVKCQSAKMFKSIDNKMYPCAPSDEKGKPMTFQNLIGKQVKLPPIDIDDFNQAFIKTKPSVGLEDIQDHIKFTKEFGQEG